MTDQHRFDEHEEALNVLALLCGSLIRSLRQHGHMTDGEVDGLIRGLQASAETNSALVINVVDQVSWAAERNRDLGEPHSVDPGDEARGAHEAPGGPRPTVR